MKTVPLLNNIIYGIMDIDYNEWYNTDGTYLRMYFHIWTPNVSQTSLIVRMNYLYY
jgi:hypothetical protein